MKKVKRRIKKSITTQAQVVIIYKTRAKRTRPKAAVPASTSERTETAAFAVAVLEKTQVSKYVPISYRSEMDGLPAGCCCRGWRVVGGCL